MQHKKFTMLYSRNLIFCHVTMNRKTMILYDQVFSLSQTISTTKSSAKFIIGFFNKYRCKALYIPLSYSINNWRLQYKQVKKHFFIDNIMRSYELI